MVDSKKLRILMFEKNLTQENVAALIGITPKTLSAKMKKGVFDSDEMYALIHILEIKDPVEIFFADKVTF